MAEDPADADLPKLANLFAQQASVTKNWAKSWLAKRYEASIDVTLGHSASIVSGFPMGSTSEVVTGGSMSLTLDPSGWIDNGTLQQAQDLLAPMGDWSGLFGSGRSLHYGPALSIHHGAEINRRASQTFDAANPRTHFVGGIVTAATALTMLGWRKHKDDPVAWENLVRTLGPRGVSGMLLNLLIEFEKATGECDAGVEKQSEASSLNTQVDALGADYASLVLGVASKVTEQGTALATAGQTDQAAEQSDAGSEDTSVDDAENAGEAEGGDDDAGSSDDAGDPDSEPDANTDDLEFGTDSADVYQCYDGLVATGARHISLRARATDESDTDASLIHLDAQGAEGSDNGVVAINSTGQATVVCGPAAVQIRRSGDTGQVDITTGDQGAITLTTGGESGSKAVMNPDGITLSVGAEGSGTVITMTSTGIKLSVGAGGGPCLELTTSGVTMSCGSNSVAVDQSGQTTKGMNVSHQADMNFEAKGTMVSVQGSGQTTVKGAVTMIN
ncbi:hypothetical protein Pla108_19390 [Botrimarina colliarenosi]|uniref:Uncharacterized protein n=1 Tax=Botrimarina colliarenosi TaxID=2528001 RepID=A0A5C6AEF1_9BACT|nr:hypothetical protein [Botrimarina colliarenosi]TWT97787.1 hypothetical protein Pla108_19390 [Botrimarina colliarenosi]